MQRKEHACFRTSEPSGQNNCTILKMDDFYRPQAEAEILSGVANLDKPEAFNINDFVAAFDSLRNGRNAVTPIYDRKSIRIRGTMALKARNVLIVEGLFVLHDRRISDFLSSAIFLDINPNAQLTETDTRCGGK